MFVLALEHAGIEAREAPSADAALEVIEAGNWGAVVSDIRMPGMSGIDLVRKLRSRAATAKLPVLLMTTMNGPDGLVEAIEAGADDFLVKSARLEELVARVLALPIRVARMNGSR